MHPVAALAHNKHIKVRNLTRVVLLIALLLGTIGGLGLGNTYAQGKRFANFSEVASTSAVEVRDQPSTSGQVLTTLPVNTKATVLGGPFNDDWYWLEHETTRGYAQGKSFVQVDENYKPIPTETPTPLPTVTPEPTATLEPTATPLPPTPVPTVAAQNATESPATDTVFSTRPGEYTGLWLGEMAKAGQVRTGPGGTSKVLKSWWVGRRVLLYQAANDANGGLWYRVSEPPETPMWVHSSLIRKVAPVKFEGAKYPGKWVNVNITQQIVTAYQGGTPMMVTLASTGTTKNPTEIGVWKIFYRLLKDDMEGGSKATGDYYNLKNVPYTQYFHISGEGLHGTYWHDNFGRRRSHGCVNLSTPIAGWLYNWATMGTVVWTHY
jgi:lipoprotein-anchoring transpeptidase ErfK/SrfK